MKKYYILLAALFISVTLNAQIINIPDANFKSALIDRGVDTNNDGEIQISEAEAWTQTLYLNNWNIASIEGIEYFINTSYFSCTNNQLTSIDLSGLNNLVYFSCSNNMITSLNIENNPQLGSLICQNNLITDLNLDNNPLLESIRCNDNLISFLDLTNQPNLTSVNVFNNQITELIFGNVPYNANSGTFNLDCSNNNLTVLDLSTISQTQHEINVSNNNLTTLILKNGASNYYSYPEHFGQVYLTNNPDLTFVCVDEDEFETSYIRGRVAGAGLTNCVVNSYCSFVPGSEYYTVEGNIKIDLDSNGCDTNDVIVSNLNFSITNGYITGSFISDATGNYSIPVQEGNHTITPTLDSNYFTVTPSSIDVDFPTNISPYLQDFCVTSNGTYHDLEITLLPTEAARPGFNTNYKLVYKNKGTTTLSGAIDLNFMDAIMDFVSASPNEDSQSADVLSWNFIDLTALEVREIVLTMNINAPTDSPPVNGGDILEFIASVNTPEIDETPDDNLAILNQTVVNSFDPNDKTCLEGDVITPEMVGKYVHYMIRFENTGTANAINIVVKDDIDTSKYDLSTLVPIDASHDFVARIKDQGSSHYVEFIFENINLPFDDANNDGYIAFKIKTLNSLQLGDTFENNAEIYFDYNFPIITNVVQTTVATLSVDEFELANSSVSLYPNPTTNLLHIDAQQNIQHVSIFDVSGRLIKNIAIIGEKTNLDISTESLTSGSYFVKIESVNGTLVRKVIKD